MNLKLTIEGSASQLALVLAALGGVGTTVTGVAPETAMMPPEGAPSIMMTPLALASTTPPLAAAASADDEGTANAAPPQLDVSGLPWDERIHAGTKALTDDGMWRKRRGVAKQTVEAVEAQLRAASAAAPVVMPLVAPLAAAVVVPPPVMPIMPPPLAAPVAPPMPIMPPPLAAAPVVPPMPVAPAPEPEPIAIAAAPVAPPMPVAQPEPAPQPQPAATTLDFAQFMQHISSKMAQAATAGDAARIDFTNYLTTMTAEIAGAFQVALGAITDIAANPQMIVYASQVMQRDGRW